MRLTPYNEDSVKSNHSDSSSQDQDEGRLQYQKNQQYLALPPHVRDAIDKVKMKSKHSDFYERLKSLNSKIKVYK